MKKTTKSEVLQVRLLPEQIEGLDEAAKLCGVRVSALVRMLIDNFLEGRKQDGNK